MNITKKVCIYILVGLITITGTFSSFYKGVYAFEYVGGALAFEEAIKWLLASVGIISAGGMTADYWEQHGDEFVDYCTEQNITDTEVANWQLKLCEGILDKSSACWQAFKEWASTLTGSNSGGGSGVISGYNGTVQQLYNTIPFESAYNFDFSNFSDTYNFCIGLYQLNDSKKITYLWFITDCTIIGEYRTTGTSNISFVYLTSNNSKNIYFSGSTLSGNISTLSSNTRYSFNINCYHNYSYYFPFDSSLDYSSLTNAYGVDEWITGNTVSDSDFISVQSDVTDLDIISSPLPDTDAQEVAIPMPGVSDSDNEASASAYDDIIDAVNNGQIELDDAITQIQDILKIIVYEEETEKIFPKPDNEEDQEDLDDKINQNKDNMGFTLGGLETVFPFCIPWDIYAFMSLLRADPVPPKVELPFPNPLDPENPWIVEVDFSDWDDGMRVVRLAEDFLFIIGLAVLTRSLIGAGGGDG